MKHFITLLIVSLLSLSAVAEDLGTMTQSKLTQGPILVHALSWTSGTNNNSVIAVTPDYVRGELLRVSFIPSSTARPTNTYSLTLKDSSGIDILNGLGSALASNATSTIRPGIPYNGEGSTNAYAPYALNELLTLAVTNVGMSKSGTVVLYVR